MSFSANYLAPEVYSAFTTPGILESLRTVPALFLVYHL